MQRYEHGGDVYGNGGIPLDLSVNINPLGMPESVKQAIIEHIPEYAAYPDPDCRTLRAMLAARHDLEASLVLCGNGAAELIFTLCACIKPRRTLTLAPTFSEYERAIALFGGQVYEHRLLETDGFSLTESILEELTPEIDLLTICNPNNPTGMLCNPSLLCELAEACLKNGTLLLLDECFIEFTRGESSMTPHLSAYPNLLILQAFTKIYAMAGLRLGTLYCADKRLLLRIADFSPAWNVSSVAQAAGIAALAEEGWAERTRNLVERERAFMTEAIRGFGITVYHSDANFLLMKYERSLWEPLRKRGILVRSCANFTGLDERYIRVGLKTNDKNRALIDALSEVLHG